MTRKIMNNIVFIEKDNPQAAERLQAAMARAGEIPILGLILKVEPDPSGNDRLVNWMFADADFIRSMALVLPQEDNGS